MKRITIYTDGACINNPGPGGYGAILLFKNYRKEISGGYTNTTNNRMEIVAVIKALQVLTEPCSIKLLTDSKYLVNSVEKGWLDSWEKNNWQRKINNNWLLVPNTDLWGQLKQLLKIHSVSFVWLKGHSGIEENEACHKLAYMAAKGESLIVDEGFLDIKSN